MSAKAHFQLQFKQFEHVTKSGNIVLASSCQYRKQAWCIQTLIMHTIAYFIVHTNIHFQTKAYHMVYTSIHFHTITYCIALHTRNIHIAHHSMLHCTHKTFILHNKAYCIVHAKHSHCTLVYKTQLSFEVCHSCVRFHIVCFDTYEARSAQYVSTANQFCCRRQQNVTFRTLYS